MKHGITSEKFLKAAKARPDAVACGTEFPIQVTASTTIANCSAPTDQEQQTMMNALLFNWRNMALAACSQAGGNCPSPQATAFVPTSTCVKGSDGKNVWTIAATITTKCVAV